MTVETSWAFYLALGAAHRRQRLLQAEHLDDGRAALSARAAPSATAASRSSTWASTSARRCRRCSAATSARPTAGTTASAWRRSACSRASRCSWRPMRLTQLLILGGAAADRRSRCCSSRTIPTAWRSTCSSASLWSSPAVGGLRRARTRRTAERGRSPRQTSAQGKSAVAGLPGDAGGGAGVHAARAADQHAEPRPTRRMGSGGSAAHPLRRAWHSAG